MVYFFLHDTHHTALYCAVLYCTVFYCIYPSHSLLYQDFPLSLSSKILSFPRKSGVLELSVYR